MRVARGVVLDGKASFSAEAVTVVVVAGKERPE